MFKIYINNKEDFELCKNIFKKDIDSPPLTYNNYSSEITMKLLIKNNKIEDFCWNLIKYYNCKNCCNHKLTKFDVCNNKDKFITLKQYLRIVKLKKILNE